MKDILIKGNRIKTELKYWGASFVLAFILNAYAIIKYNTNWSELFTQIHFVIIVSFIIYAFFILLRLLISTFNKVMKK